MGDYESYIKDIEVLERQEHTLWLAVEAQRRIYEDTDSRDKARKRKQESILGYKRHQHKRALEAVLKRHQKKLQANLDAQRFPEREAVG